MLALTLTPPHVCLSQHPQIRNEQLSSIVRKMEGEADYVSKNVSAMVERQQRLSEQLDKLGRSLEQTEERLKRAAVEAKVSRNGCRVNNSLVWLVLVVLLRHAAVVGGQSACVLHRAPCNCHASM